MQPAPAFLDIQIYWDNILMNLGNTGSDTINLSSGPL